MKYEQFRGHVIDDHLWHHTECLSLHHSYQYHSGASHCYVYHTVFLNDFTADL